MGVNWRRQKLWSVTVIGVILSMVLWAAWQVLTDGVLPGSMARSDPRMFELPQVVVARSGPAPETGRVARRYKQLIEDGTYNAALALNPTGGFGWADNHARIEEAEQVAMAWCDAEGPGCEIILRVTPERIVEVEGQPMSRTAAEAALAYLRHPRTKALAITEQGGWGGAWNRKTREDAVASAMAGCRKHEVTTAPQLRIASECRLIWVD